MKRYLNINKIEKNIKKIFVFLALLLCSGVTLARAETTAMNYNLNRALDLQTMAEVAEKILLEEVVEEEQVLLPEITYVGRVPHSNDDLIWLAYVIHREAGSNWLTDEHQLKVGNVVLNRVESSRFRGNSIHAILHARGQYSWVTGSNVPRPSDRALRNAQKLLDGYRILPPNVIWQANFRQGRGCYSIVPCPRGVLRTSYFCY